MPTRLRSAFVGIGALLLLLATGVSAFAASPALPEEEIVEPEVADKNEVEMLQDLIVAAFNDAATKVDEALAQKLGGLGSGLKIPGLF